MPRPLEFSPHAAGNRKSFNVGLKKRPSGSRLLGMSLISSAWSTGETLYLALVLVAFLSFAVALAYVSTRR